MAHKCDKCDRPATCHQVEVVHGAVREKHLCDLHAAEEGGSLPSDLAAALNQMLGASAAAKSGAKPGGKSAARPERPRRPVQSCPSCGMNLDDFENERLLGCPECYAAFEGALQPLIERNHSGASHHVGKVPALRGGGGERRVVVERLRRRLAEAVKAEDYAAAARLRDEIRRMEAGAAPAAPEAGA